MKKHIRFIIVAGLVAGALLGLYAGRSYLSNGDVSGSRHAYSPTSGLTEQAPAEPTPTTSPTPKEPPRSDGGEQGNKTTVTLSNTRHGWGIKRNDNHQQPEMPKGIRDTLARYDAFWIGSPGEKVLYLTFDEGYENGYTPKILDILKANNVKAAFFVTGHYVKSQPDLVKRMVAEGHIVGNHTMNHPSLPDVSDEQIKKELQSVEALFTKLTGQKMRYLRPPKGEYSERTLAVTRQLGYYNIFWSLALVDWVPMPGGAQEAYQSVMDNLHNGALILLHAVSKDDTEALDRILKDARARGYTFKTLDDLVAGK